MKISNDSPVTPPDSTPVQREAARTEQKPAQPEDTVRISTPVNASDPARAARIEQLSAAVQNGSYRVLPEEIAASIVNEMLQK